MFVTTEDSHQTVWYSEKKVNFLGSKRWVCWALLTFTLEVSWYSEKNVGPGQWDGWTGKRMRGSIQRSTRWLNANGWSIELRLRNSGFTPINCVVLNISSFHLSNWQCVFIGITEVVSTPFSQRTELKIIWTDSRWPTMIPFSWCPCLCLVPSPSVGAGPVRCF